MEISLTLFNSIFDNKTDKRMDLSSWEEFENLLYGLSAIEREGKKDAQLISPATYLVDSTRANANVVDWGGWAAVDVDDHNFNGQLKDELFSRFGSHYYICYSTASSKDDFPKFRLVFPLTTKVEQSRIKHFWFALNEELGRIGDGQTKDLSRMYYIPASYAGANNFIFTNVAGSWINPMELMNKHPMIEKQGKTFLDRLPESIQKEVINHRKSKMENTSITWQSYNDCPFVNKKLVDDYKAINGTGWYHTMYRLMVSIAANAVRREYPITAHEVAVLCRELDAETGHWYQGRSFEVEADRAIEFVYKNM